jgi:enoyl reductase-like protein
VAIPHRRVVGPLWGSTNAVRRFFFARRMMVAKEAHTSPSVKDLIAAASGVDDSQWDGTYTKPTGAF